MKSKIIQRKEKEFHHLKGFPRFFCIFKGYLTPTILRYTKITDIKSNTVKTSAYYLFSSGKIAVPKNRRCALSPYFFYLSIATFNKSLISSFFARSSAVWPSLFFAFTSAPFSIRNLTVSV